MFRALFPSGAVTGAPKIAACATIAELEPAARGIYCGAIGWLAPPREPVRARFSVAIRTAVVDTRANTLVYGAGGTVTTDADAEQDELVAKTAVLTASPRVFDLLETTATLAVHIDGMWWTPPLEAGCLPAVARRLASEHGRLRERSLTACELSRADCIAVVSALRGWRPASVVPWS